MSLSAKIYRFLLRAYPRDHRVRYAEPMEQLFRDRLREVHSPVDLIPLWARTIVDWAVSVITCHREEAARRTVWRTARPCLFFARMEASSFSRREITVEHLLLGVLREEPSLVPALVLESVLRAIEANEPAGRRVPSTQDLRFSREVIRVLASARKSAHRAGREEVAPADLMAGILGQTDSLAARLLRQHFSDRT